MKNLFEYSGLANKEDLNSELWSKTFQILEKYQESFVSLKPFPEKYPWPKDPLHSWSRAWEYPYVYYHLQNLTDKQNQTVLDIGSGVTFFPFAVKALGFGKVIALDTDQTYVESYEALNVAKGVEGSVEFQLGSALKLPFSKNSIDLVYCISVLEHIPNSSLVLDEIYNVLKPGGRLVLTFDLDLMGGLELSPSEFNNLKSLIRSINSKLVNALAIYILL